jgi:hypothetical protein
MLFDLIGSDGQVWHIVRDCGMILNTHTGVVEHYYEMRRGEGPYTAVYFLDAEGRTTDQLYILKDAIGCTVEAGLGRIDNWRRHP